jgi:hypothetical protein
MFLERDHTDHYKRSEIKNKNTAEKEQKDPKKKQKKSKKINDSSPRSS